MKQFLIILAFCATTNIATDCQPSTQGQKNQGYEIGSTAEDFSMKNVDGKTYSLASIEDAKGYIVIFTSNVCPFAVGYEDRMIELHKQMAPKGYPVVAINSNDGSPDSGDNFDAMITRYNEKDFPFVYLKDEKGVYNTFGATKTPHVFLLDKDLVVRYIGAIDDSARESSEVEEQYVVNAIAALESGDTPNPETTKAIGCPIKSKGGGGKKGERKGPPAPDQIMADMDANKDQQITKAEARGPLAGDFDRIDKNKDGVLTMEELASLRKVRK